MKNRIPAKKILACFLTVIITMPILYTPALYANITSVAAADEKKMIMWYNTEAANSEWGWLDQSFPMGNGYMGVNLFGRIATERIQITENSTQDSNDTIGGLNNFAEVYIDFPGHTTANSSNYRRELVLDDGLAHVQYVNGGVTYEREYFTSYPDKIMAIKLTSSGNNMVNFTLRPTIPYLCNYRQTSNDNRGKRGTVTAEGDTITLSGTMDYFNLQFEGQFKVMPVGGNMTANSNGTITVTGADSAVILIAIGTNYIVGDSKVIDQSNRLNKLAGNPHPHAKVTQYISDASAKTYDELLANHETDYKGLYGRVNFDLGGVLPTVPLDTVINNYRNGTVNLYLEELAFQFGRYLLICSSRKGGLPPNLQGMWNVHQDPPWRAGYWHNVNLQMNYWLAFPGNLPELFEAYIDYYRTYLPSRKTYATSVIPAARRDPGGDNGWAYGNSSWPYSVGGRSAHSGFGTGPWTAMMFWDYYDFTRDEDLLRNVVYDAIYGSANFASRFVSPIDGKLLANPSSSPENGDGYQTIGATFDQTTFYEIINDTLKAADVLGYSNANLDRMAGVLPLLDPIVIGKSGQIKEYREEGFYGEIGEYTHRHISQLLGSFPGQMINSTTPAWMDASWTSLKLRGDYPSTEKGWSKAERIANYARVLDGEMAYGYYKNWMQRCALHNLWNAHDCNVTASYSNQNVKFQSDGSFGVTAGVCEMLLQSSEYAIAPLPAMPAAWANGSYKGLLARGNFEVSAEWANTQAVKFEILSKSGGECQVKYQDIKDAVIKTADGQPVQVSVINSDLVSFDSVKGETYVITSIPAKTTTRPATNLQLRRVGGAEVSFSWTASPDAVAYNLYRAEGSSPTYDLVASNITGTSYNYAADAIMYGEQYTFCLKAVGANGRESTSALKLMLKPDKDELASLLSKASSFTRANFKTDELWEDLADAIITGQALMTNEFADYADIDEAIFAMKTAMAKVLIDKGSVPTVNMSVGSRNLYLTHVVKMERAAGTNVTEWRIAKADGTAVTADEAVIDRHEGIVFSRVEDTFRIQQMNGNTVVSICYLTFNDMFELPRLALVNTTGTPLTQGAPFCRTTSSSYPHWGVFDGNTATFYECSVGSAPYETWVGWDFGEKTKVNTMVYCPRISNWQERINGVRLQGSNTSQTTGYEDLWSNTITYTANSRTTTYWRCTTFETPDPEGYRWYRWYDPNASNYNHCNVSEIEWYLNVDKTDLVNAALIAKDLCEGNYTPETWAPFKKALDDALPVYESFYLSTALIQEVTPPLEKALNELVVASGSALEYVNNTTFVMPKQLVNDTKLTLPATPEGYTIEFKPGSSSNAEVVSQTGVVTPPETNTSLNVVLRVSKGDVYADTQPLSVLIPRAEEIFDELTLSVDTLVEKKAANLKVDIAGGPGLIGKTVSVKIVANDDSIVYTAAPAVAGSDMLSMRLSLTALQMAVSPGDYKVVAATLEAADAISADLVVRADAVDIWNPVIDKIPGDSAATTVRISFASNIIFKGSVSIDGTAYSDIGAEENILEVYNVPASAITSKSVIVISGVEYPKLFPSYSLKFTLGM